MSKTFTPHSKIVDELLVKAKQKLPKEARDIFSRFIVQYYSQVDANDLVDYKLDDLYAMVWSHWELLQNRKPGTVKLRVFNPVTEQDGFCLPYTIIQLSIDNMPFLVDSLNIAINRLGYEVRLSIHTGGLVVLRDRRGRIKDIQPCRFGNQEELTEAPVSFYIDSIADQAELDDINLCLDKVIYDITLAVDDWQPMRESMEESRQGLLRVKSHLHADRFDETMLFIDWLSKNHFVYLGVVDYRVTEDESGLVIEHCHNSGLGVFHDHPPVDQISYCDVSTKAKLLAQEKDVLLIFCKSDIKSTVHRSVDMDLVIIKQFDKNCRYVGERQFYGLLASSAFVTDPRTIPLLSGKISRVMEYLDVPPVSYAGKKIKYILQTLPRDTLFECDEKELAHLAMGISQLQERRQLRLFTYRSILGSTISCLVFMPRDNFNTEIVYKMQSKLEDSFSAMDSSFSTSFGRSALVRIQYSLHVKSNQVCTVDLKQVESSLSKMSRTWQDDLYRSITTQYQAEDRAQMWVQYAYAFPAGYREDFDTDAAARDIKKLEALTDEARLGMSFYSREEEAGMLRLKFFHAQHTITLSDTLPIVENMNMRVIGEHPYELTLKDGRNYWINDFHLQYTFEEKVDMQQFGKLLQDTISAVWYGRTENDRLNRLVLSANLSWREVSVFRAYARYMRQAGFTYSQQYIEDTLASYPQIVKMLFEYFNMRFNPDHRPAQELLEKQSAAILASLDLVSSLDEDKILRRYLELINATLRINYFQKPYQAGQIHYTAIKLFSPSISDLPQPVPEFEIYVYSPRFEGVHLRVAKVARGGLRWSDRREDFRTEVLGLMKAQQVKNAVIVPQGAKGGFVLKQVSALATRDEFLQEGVACYKQFISGLLDLTDNIVDEQIIPPTDVVCYDENDPYLVVAADKGTATFSDLANQIAVERGFWLGDAFASGGSAGYDHKKIGITARGAWVAAEEHFRNLNINLAQDTVRVVGVGDMAGDVFGNGMLMSDQIQLVAAFNHLHIFIDPKPNLKKSYRERKRLFQMPRSSWDDYDRGLISRGGGVYKRSAKVIKLAPEVMEALNIEQEELNPNQLIQAILLAPVDLLWNGGVGTFIKSSHEEHAAVGDRSNDSLRVDGKDLRVKVICEGGNLGLTQLARIEYALTGGLINTDFIDNSAGVDCSDQEVNIKIMLQSIVRSKQLDQSGRNELLLSMTDEVKGIVLKHNIEQSRAITINTKQAIRYFNLYQRYMEHLAQTGRIDPVVEYLPDEQALTDRLSKGVGLTRPEVAVLFSYSKIDLKEQLLTSRLLEDPFFDAYLQAAFPTVLFEKYSEAIRSHPLRFEIIATQVVNYLVADMGLSFVYQMQDETSSSVSDVVRSYVIASHVFGVRNFFNKIAELNYIIPVEVQHSMSMATTNLVRRSTRWLLREKDYQYSITAMIERFNKLIDRLFARLPKLLLGEAKEKYEAQINELKEVGVPQDLADRIASVKAMYHSWNIATLVFDQEVELYRVAKIYFMIVDRLDLFWFREVIDSYPSDSRWAILAKASYKGDLDFIQRALTSSVLQFETKAKSIPGRLRAWSEHHATTIERWKPMLAALRAMDVKDFAILSIAIRHLDSLAQAD